MDANKLAVTGLGPILRGDDADDAGSFQRPARIEAQDARVGVGAAQKPCARAARQLYVVDVLPPPGQEPEILGARQRLSNVHSTIRTGSAGCAHSAHNPLHIQLRAGRPRDPVHAFQKVPAAILPPPAVMRPFFAILVWLVLVSLLLVGAIDLAERLAIPWSRSRHLVQVQ